MTTTARDRATDIIDIALETFWAKTRENTDDRLLADEAIKLRQQEALRSNEGDAGEPIAWVHECEFGYDVHTLKASAELKLERFGGTVSPLYKAAITAAEKPDALKMEGE